MKATCVFGEGQRTVCRFGRRLKPPFGGTFPTSSKVSANLCNVRPDGSRQPSVQRSVGLRVVQ